MHSSITSEILQQKQNSFRPYLPAELWLQILVFIDHDFTS